MTTPTINEMADLYPLLELTGIRVFEVSARRRDGFDLDQPSVETGRSNLDVSVQAETTAITFRSRIDVSTPDALIAADVAAVFSVRQEIGQLSDQVLDEFARTTGLPVVLPYLRVQVQQLARQIGVSAPLLKHYWAPDFERMTISR